MRCRPQLSLTADHRRCREKAHCGIRWPCAADKRNKSTGSAPGTFSISPGRCLVARPAVCHTLLGCARPSGVAGRGRDARCDRRGERSGRNDAGRRVGLAGVGVAIMERRPTGELAESRAGGFHSRTIEILDQRGIADRFLAEGKTRADGPVRQHGSGYQRLSDAAPVRAWPVAEPDAADPRGLDRPARSDRSPRMRSGRFRPGRIRCRCRSRRWPESSGGVPRRCRRRPQHGPQERGHRLPRMGRDPQQPDCRSPGLRGAAVGHASG